MATTNSSRDRGRYATFQELASELQHKRPGVHGAKMATHLLRFADGRDLVGVSDHTHRAIYYEFASRSIVAVRFDKHGVEKTGRELLVRGIDDPATWVDAYGDGFTWIHPWYR